MLIFHQEGKNLKKLLFLWLTLYRLYLSRKRKSQTTSHCILDRKETSSQLWNTREGLSWPHSRIPQARAASHRPCRLLIVTLISSLEILPKSMVMDKAQTSPLKIKCLILRLALICRKFKKTKFQKIYNSLKTFREVLQLKRSRMKSRLTSKLYQRITKIKSQVSILDRLAEKRQNVMQFHHGLQTSTTAKFFPLRLWRPAQAVSGLVNASQTKDSGQKG
jgi:hypothetical protein